MQLLTGWVVPARSDAQLSICAPMALAQRTGNRSIKDIPHSDHMRAAMTSYHAMVLAQTTIRLAWRYCHRMRLVRHGEPFPFSSVSGLGSCGVWLALVPPFVLALTFPLQSGITELSGEDVPRHDKPHLRLARRRMRPNGCST